MSFAHSVRSRSLSGSPRKNGGREQHDVELFAARRLEQIALPHFDPIFDLVEQGIDVRAAHCRRLDVYGQYLRKT